MIDRRRAFLEAYLADPRRNATKAADQAGYRWPSRQGHRLTTYPSIANVIKAETEKLLQRFKPMSESEIEAMIERDWRSMPEWYRLGLAHPQGLMRRSRRRRCM